MLSKKLVILLGLLIAGPAYAQIGAYRIMNLADTDLLKGLVVKRNFNEIKLKAMSDLAQPLYPGDVVRIVGSDVSLKLSTPAGDNVTLSGLQEVRLPAENGTWWHLKRALFDVKTPTKAELDGLTISADRARYDIAVADDNTMTVKVYTGSAAVTSYYHGLASKEVRANHYLKVAAGRAMPEPALLSGVSDQADLLADASPASSQRAQSANGAAQKNGAPKSAPKANGNGQPVEIVPVSRQALPAASASSSEGAQAIPAASPNMEKNRRNPPTPYANIPPINDGNSWFSRNKWFVVGAGLVTGGVVTAAVVGKKGGSDTAGSLSELPAPPGPKR